MRLLGKNRNADLVTPLQDFSVLPGSSFGARQVSTGKAKGRCKTKYDTSELDEQGPHAERPDKSWHLNLRSTEVHKPANGWRRHFIRPFQTFDHLKVHLADKASRETYENSEGTPRAANRWRPDRQKGHWGGILARDDDANFTRASGCEGAHAGLWMHLFQARHERAQLGFETTLREADGDEHGARVNDNRSDGCIVEMLGKKKWYNASPKRVDLKLDHLEFLKATSEPDEDNRKARVAKTPRRDAAICGTPVGTPVGTPAGTPRRRRKYFSQQTSEKEPSDLRVRAATD